jgi:hypothetical protein
MTIKCKCGKTINITEIKKGEPIKVICSFCENVNVLDYSRSLYLKYIFLKIYDIILWCLTPISVISGAFIAFILFFGGSYNNHKILNIIHVISVLSFLAIIKLRKYWRIMGVIVLVLLIIMNLPTGYNIPKYIFYGDGINKVGVVHPSLNIIQFYEKRSDSWDLLSERNLNLPKKGFKDIICIDYNNLGLIIENKIHFYQFDNSWKYISGKDYTLPDQYKGIIGTLNTIGIISDDKLIFYHYDKSWSKSSFISDFVLPNDYTDIVLLKDHFFLGVLVYNKIQFYRCNVDNLWEYIEDFTFPDYVTSNGKKIGRLVDLGGNYLGFIVEGRNELENTFNYLTLYGEHSILLRQLTFKIYGTFINKN